MGYFLLSYKFKCAVSMHTLIRECTYMDIHVCSPSLKIIYASCPTHCDLNANSHNPFTLPSLRQNWFMNISKMIEKYSNMVATLFEIPVENLDNKSILNASTLTNNRSPSQLPSHHTYIILKFKNKSMFFKTTLQDLDWPFNNWFSFITNIIVEVFIIISEGQGNRIMLISICHRAVQAWARLDPFITERWRSTSMLSTWSHQCWRLPTKAVHV